MASRDGHREGIETFFSGRLHRRIARPSAAVARHGTGSRTATPDVAVRLRRFGASGVGIGYLRDGGDPRYSRYNQRLAEAERAACRPLRRSPCTQPTSRRVWYGEKSGLDGRLFRQRRVPALARDVGANPCDRGRSREHKAIRENVALIDMSSFSKFELGGPGALRFLQWLAAGNIDRPEGAVVYTQLLNAKGGIEADLTIMRPSADVFYVVTGSGFGVRDGRWIRSHMPRDGSVLQDGQRLLVSICAAARARVSQRRPTTTCPNTAFPI